MFRKLMSNSRVLRHEIDIDLGSVAPDNMSTDWKVSWDNIMAALMLFQGGDLGSIIAFGAPVCCQRNRALRR